MYHGSVGRVGFSPVTSLCMASRISVSGAVRPPPVPDVCCEMMKPLLFSSPQQKTKRPWQVKDCSHYPLTSKHRTRKRRKRQGTVPGACQELCRVAYHRCHVGCTAASKSPSPPRDTDDVFVLILAQISILGLGAAAIFGAELC